MASIHAKSEVATVYNGIMLQLSGQIINRPILSLRTGGPIAVVSSPIINPAKLTIEGFYVQDTVDKKTLILLVQDIREFSKQGYIVNDLDALAPPEDLIRLKQLIELDYQLINKRVETVSKQYVGKVSSYAVESTSMAVKKLYASQSFWKNLTGGSLSIDRSQIVEVTNQRIIINELLQGERAAVPMTAPVV